MLYAILICTDEACAEEFEAWGEPDDFDQLVCDGCGCVLQAVAFSAFHGQPLGPKRSVRIRSAGTPAWRSREPAASTNPFEPHTKARPESKAA